MPKMSFVVAKSVMDEAKELHDQMVKKAADTVIKYIGGISREKKTSELMTEIDKLLQDFSTEDKYKIMKHAFIGMQ